VLTFNGMTEVSYVGRTEEMAEGMGEIIHKINLKIRRKDRHQHTLAPLPPFNVSREFTNPNAHPPFCEMLCASQKCDELVKETYPLDTLFLPYEPPVCSE